MSCFCCSHSSREWRFLTCCCLTESVELSLIDMTELRSMVSMEDVVRDRLEGRGTAAYHERQRYSRSTLMAYENVRLGIRGHLNALEGHVRSQRSKSALEHAPETGLEERMIVSFVATISRSGSLTSTCRHPRCRRTGLRHRVFLPRQKCIG